MKIDKTLVILWIASLSIFTGAGVAVLMASDWMNGVPGLAIRFFLGYCGIIVVAQVCAFMEVIRRQREDFSKKNSRYQAGIESV